MKPLISVSLATRVEYEIPYLRSTIYEWRKYLDEDIYLEHFVIYNNVLRQPRDIIRNVTQKIYKNNY